MNHPFPAQVDCGHAQPDDAEDRAVVVDAEESAARADVARLWRKAVGRRRSSAAAAAPDASDSSSSDDDDFFEEFDGAPAAAAAAAGGAAAVDAAPPAAAPDAEELDPMERNLADLAPPKNATRAELRRRAARIQRFVEDVGLPHARARLGRLRATALAVDVAASSASLAAELHELRVFVVEGLRRRGIDVADAAYRRLARSGASDWLDALARRQDLLDDAVQDVTRDIDAVVAVGRAADEALDDLFEVESDGDDVCVVCDDAGPAARPPPRRRGPKRAHARTLEDAWGWDVAPRGDGGPRPAKKPRGPRSPAAPDVWGFEADDAPRREAREPRGPREPRRESREPREPRREPREPRGDRPPRGEPRAPRGDRRGDRPPRAPRPPRRGGAARRPARAELAAPSADAAAAFAAAAARQSSAPRAAPPRRRGAAAAAAAARRYLSAARLGLDDVAAAVHGASWEAASRRGARDAGDAAAALAGAWAARGGGAAAAAALAAGDAAALAAVAEACVGDCLRASTAHDRDAAVAGLRCAAAAAAGARAAGRAGEAAAAAAATARLAALALARWPDRLGVAALAAGRDDAAVVGGAWREAAAGAETPRDFWRFLESEPPARARALACAAAAGLRLGGAATRDARVAGWAALDWGAPPVGDALAFALVFSRCGGVVDATVVRALWDRLRAAAPTLAGDDAWDAGDAGRAFADLLVAAASAEDGVRRRRLVGDFRQKCRGAVDAARAAGGPRAAAFVCACAAAALLALVRENLADADGGFVRAAKAAHDAAGGDAPGAHEAALDCCGVLADLSARPDAAREGAAWLADLVNAAAKRGRRRAADAAARRLAAALAGGALAGDHRRLAACVVAAASAAAVAPDGAARAAAAALAPIVDAVAAAAAGERVADPAAAVDWDDVDVDAVLASNAARDRRRGAARALVRAGAVAAAGDAAAAFGAAEPCRAVVDALLHAGLALWAARDDDLGAADAARRAAAALANCARRLGAEAAATLAVARDEHPWARGLLPGA